MKRIMTILAIIVILGLNAGCAGKTPAAPTSTYPPPINIEPMPPTETPRPTVSLPTAPPTATAAPTQVIFSPVSAIIVFDNYLLRSGPGRNFARLGIYAEGDTVLVTARALGKDWVYVQASDFYSGWMNTVGLESAGDFGNLPVMNAPDAILIKGHVWNKDGSPAPNIGVAFQPLNNPDPDLMDNVMTGADGAWYAYLPAGTRGEWVIGPNAYSCPPDVPSGECTLAGTFPPAQTITLPEAQDVWIEFNILPLDD